MGCSIIRRGLVDFTYLNSMLLGFSFFFIPCPFLSRFDLRMHSLRLFSYSHYTCLLLKLALKPVTSFKARSSSLAWGVSSSNVKFLKLFPFWPISCYGFPFLGVITVAHSTFFSTCFIFWLFFILSCFISSKFGVWGIMRWMLLNWSGLEGSMVVMGDIYYN